MTPNDLDPCKVKCNSYMCYYCPRVRYFCPFHSTAIFSVTCHFEKKKKKTTKKTKKPQKTKRFTKWPQMTLIITSWIYPIHVLLASLGPKFQCDQFRGHCFRDPGNFGSSGLNDPEMPWRIQGQMYPIYVSLVPPSLKCHSVALYDQPFRNTGQFETGAPDDLLWP